MEPVEVAAGFCKLIGQPDLLSWLELGPQVTGDEARAALRAQRPRMQAMQANPKYKDIARFFIKNQVHLEAVLDDPAAYRRAVARVRESEQLPTLERMIDGVLADGVISPSEANFLRDAALQLGIGEARYREVLAERAKAQKIPLPRRQRAPIDAQAPPQQGWWDAGFTRLLLGVLPPGPAAVVDVQCGLAWSALTLLPDRPEWRYIGLEPTEARVTEARRVTLSSPVAHQIQLELGRPTAIPLADGSMDLALSAMALQGLPATGPALAELRRVLRPGGLLLVVEPDRFAQQFFFDRLLDGVNAAFRELCGAVDEALALRRGTPNAADRAGIALGPRVARRMTDAGFRPTRVAIHPVQGSQVEAMSAFSRRIRGHLQQLAQTGRLPGHHPAVARAARAVDEAEREIGGETIALSCHLMPLFVTLGQRT